MKEKGIKILTWIMVLTFVPLVIYVIKTDLMMDEANLITSVFLGFLMGILGMCGIAIFIIFRRVGIAINAKVDSYVGRGGCYISYNINEKEYKGIITRDTQEIGENIEITIFKNHPRFYMSKLENSWLILFILFQLTILGFLIGICSIFSML